MHVLLIALTAGLAAQAHNPPGPRDEVHREGDRPLALVVSGGVSLGAYEAGFLYFASRAVARRVEAGSPPLVVAGASAGSVNAMIAGIESCMPNGDDDPTQSLGWKAWIPVGFDQLWRPDEVRADGVLSSQAMTTAFELVRETLIKDFPPHCEFYAGFTTTRVKPFDVKVVDGLKVPRQREKFVVRVRSEGSGRAKLTNLIVGPSGIPKPILPFSGAIENDVEALGKVLFASGSFPAAFHPKVIPHCLVSSGSPDAGLSCPQDKIRYDRFIDGGIFDNGPLYLAYEIVNRSGESKDTLFAYVDPWTRAYPPLIESEGAERPPGKPPFEPSQNTLSYALGVANSFVTTARARELYAFAEHDLGDRIVLSRSHFPAAGDLFYAFFGFFERDIRIFDFYLGMYDAWVLLKRLYASGRFERAPRDPSLNYPGEAAGPWKPFLCLRRWLSFDPSDSHSSCDDDPELENLRILAQLALERLYHHCSKLSRSDFKSGEFKHKHCEAAANRKEPPVWVEGVPPWKDDLPLGSTGGVLDRLADLRFEYRDMGLSRSQSDRIRSVLRKKFVAIAERVAEVDENRSVKSLLSISGRAFANQLTYEPPELSAGVMVGSRDIEANILWTPYPTVANWLRLSLAFQARNWISVVPGEPTYLGLGVAAGPEIFMTPWVSGFLQPSFGVRGGYQLSTWDDFRAETCEATEELNDNRACSQFLLQSFAALGIVDRVRLQLNLDIFPERLNNRISDDGLQLRQFPVRLSIMGGFIFF